MLLISNTLKQINEYLKNDKEISSFFKDIYTAYRTPLIFPALFFEIINFLDYVGYYKYFDLVANFVIFSKEDVTQLYDGFEILYKNLESKIIRIPTTNSAISFNYMGQMVVDKDLENRFFFLQSGWFLKTITFT